MQEPATPDRRSRQMEIMSPRRLDALRANGNSILGTRNNNTDLEAARNYKTTQMDAVSNSGSRMGAPVRAQHAAQ